MIIFIIISSLLFLLAYLNLLKRLKKIEHGNFDIITANYMRLLGGADHSGRDDGTGKYKIGAYENQIASDLVLCNLRAWGAVYGWYAGFDGIVYMRGDLDFVKPLTQEEAENLKNKDYVSSYISEGNKIRFNRELKRYEFWVENKLVFYTESLKG